MADDGVWQYRCVAGPAVIAAKNESQRHHAVEAFEDIINREARQGWEFVAIEEFRTREPKGCLGLGGEKVIDHKMLVFRRPAATAPKRAAPADEGGEGASEPAPRRESRLDLHVPRRD